jgi:hypothetical protein
MSLSRRLFFGSVLGVGAACSTRRHLDSPVAALAEAVDPREVLHYQCPVVLESAAVKEGCFYLHPRMTRLDGDLYDSLGRTLRYQCPECNAIAYVTFG